MNEAAALRKDLADLAQGRITLLVRAGEVFHRSLDVRETLSNVARTAVESFADLCLVDLVDESTQRLYVSVGAHRDPELEPFLTTMVTPILADSARGVHPARLVAERGTTFFVPSFDEETLRSHAASDEHEAFMRFMRYGSKIVVPIVAHNAIFGALTFVRTHESSRFETDDVAVAQELGRRAGTAVANAQQYRREQHVAATLQSAFLNDQLPRTETLQFNAVYQGAHDDSFLGGDWYDVFHVGDRLVVTIGDVTGKGIDAARLMVQLRASVRMAAIVDLEPDAMLALLNTALLREGRGEMATAFIGVIDEAADTFTYASAGHPAPFAKPFGGAPRLLELDPGLPLGVTANAAFARQTTPLSAMSLLLLYTDGLTELDRNPIDGERSIAGLLADDDVFYAANPARFVTRIAHGKEARDDVAVVSLRRGERLGHWAFDVGDSSAAYAIKQDYITAIRRHAHVEIDLNTAQLIFSELVGNALRHAPGRLSLGLSADANGVWLHVMDDGPGFEAKPALPDDLWSETGRGLFLVDALAAATEIRRLPMFGTYVKVLLPTVEAP